MRLNTANIRAAIEKKAKENIRAKRGSDNYKGKNKAMFTRTKKRKGVKK